MKITNKTVAEVLTFRVEENVLRFGGKIDNWEAMHAATQRVLRADPALARRYFRDPNADATQADLGDES